MDCQITAENRSLGFARRLQRERQIGRGLSAGGSQATPDPSDLLTLAISDVIIVLYLRAMIFARG